VVCGHVYWINVFENRDQLLALLNTVMNLQVPLKAVNFLTDCFNAGLSIRTWQNRVIQSDRRLCVSSLRSYFEVIPSQQHRINTGTILKDY
jgi:hypothetical protein